MAVGDVKKRIGEMLVAGGLIKEEQLTRALEEQKKRGGRSAKFSWTWDSSTSITWQRSSRGSFISPT